MGIEYTGAYTRWEPDERTRRNHQPVDYFKFFSNSHFLSPKAENFVLRDVLYQDPLLVWVEQKAMFQPWFKI